MEFICKGRGQGKTHDLILESARTGIPILTAYNSRRIVDLARKMGIKIHQPMTIEEYKHFKNNGSLLNNKDWKGKLLIDEVDKVLEQLLGAHILKVTCTPDSMDKKENKSMLNNSFCNSKNKFTYTESSINLPNGMKVIIENGETSKIYLPKIVDVNIIVPNKVVEVMFEDGTKTKSVCKEPDVFSLEHAISICISKKVMGGSSAYNNAVKSGMKVYKEKLKREEMDKKELERIKNKRAKRLVYKKHRAERKMEEERKRQIGIYKEAYIRAMKEYMSEEYKR